MPLDDKFYNRLIIEAREVQKLHFDGKIGKVSLICDKDRIISAGTQTYYRKACPSSGVLDFGHKVGPEVDAFLRLDLPHGGSMYDFLRCLSIFTIGLSSQGNIKLAAPSNPVYGWLLSMRFRLVGWTQHNGNLYIPSISTVLKKDP
jgi:hypothetical protein